MHFPLEASSMLLQVIHDDEMFPDIGRCPQEVGEAGVCAVWQNFSLAENHCIKNPGNENLVKMYAAS